MPAWVSDAGRDSWRMWEAAVATALSRWGLQTRLDQVTFSSTRSGSRNQSIKQLTVGSYHHSSWIKSHVSECCSYVTFLWDCSTRTHYRAVLCINVHLVFMATVQPGLWYLCGWVVDFDPWNPPTHYFIYKSSHNNSTPRWHPQTCTFHLAQLDMELGDFEASSWLDTLCHIPLAAPELFSKLWSAFPSHWLQWMGGFYYT